jgi:hypothetical protein
MLRQHAAVMHCSHFPLLTSLGSIPAHE